MAIRLTSGRRARLSLNLRRRLAQGHERNLHAVPGRHGQLDVAVPRGLRAQRSPIVTRPSHPA